MTSIHYLVFLLTVLEVTHYDLFMQIRQPTSFEDFEAIADIYNAAIEPFKYIYTAEEKEMLGYLLYQTAENFLSLREKRKIFCVQIDERICGFSTHHLKMEDIIWVNSIYVRPDMQRLSIGTSLLQNLESTHPGWRIIALETHINASWAKNFYIKNEFINITDQMHLHPFNQILKSPPVLGRSVFAKLK